MNKKITLTFTFLLIFLFSYFLFLSTPALAVDVEDPPSEETAGIMHSVTADCWNEGNCQLEDMMQVFVNIANFILGIVGSLALLLFVIGGFYFLFAQGESGKITKGKDFLKGAVVGLLIVFVAYIGVQTLEMALRTGELPGTKGYALCDGTNNGTLCGTNQTCFQDKCETNCYAQSQGMSWCFDAEANFENCSSGTSSCPQAEQQQCCVVYDSPIDDINDVEETGAHNYDPDDYPLL